MQISVWSPITWIRFLKSMHHKPVEPPPLPAQPRHNRRHTDQKEAGSLPPLIFIPMEKKAPAPPDEELRKFFKIEYTYAERDLATISQNYSLIKSLLGAVAADQYVLDNFWSDLDKFDTSFELPEGFDLIDLVFLKKFQITLEDQDQRVLVRCESSVLPPEPLL
jgi:hypothetical protein